MYLQGLGRIFNGDGQNKLSESDQSGSTSTTSFVRSNAGRNVVALGLTSFFTDISSEMVVAVLPLFFLSELSLGPRSIGIFDGLYNVATAAFRLIGGRLTDKTSNPKKTALAGYGWSTLSRVGLIRLPLSLDLPNRTRCSARISGGFRFLGSLLTSGM